MADRLADRLAAPPLLLVLATSREDLKGTGTLRLGSVVYEPSRVAGENRGRLFRCANSFVRQRFPGHDFPFAKSIKTAPKVGPASTGRGQIKYENRESLKNASRHSMKKSKFNPKGGLEQHDSLTPLATGKQQCGIVGSKISRLSRHRSPLRSPQGRAFDPLVRQEEGKGQREREGEREKERFARAGLETTKRRQRYRGHRQHG